MSSDAAANDTPTACETRCESDGDTIACPHCGERNGDLWEYDVRRDKDVEIECRTCTKTRCESDGDAIACPHCGAPNGDLWEHDFRLNEDIEIECGTCAARILLSRHVSITYTARALRAPAAVNAASAGMLPPGGR